MSKQKNTAEVTAEVTAAPVDPFASLPIVTLEGDVTFRDLTDAEGNNPFKYEAVHSAARAARSPMKVGYKHARLLLIPGTNGKEFRTGSVYGDIQQIVQAGGRAGTPMVVLIARLRQAQIGNKRSKYCTALPPHGWAEGWIDTAITKNIVKPHATKQAPALDAEQVDAANAAGEEQRKLTANG